MISYDSTFTPLFCLICLLHLILIVGLLNETKNSNKSSHNILPYALELLECNHVLNHNNKDRENINNTPHFFNSGIHDSTSKNQNRIISKFIECTNKFLKSNFPYDTISILEKKNISKIDGNKTINENICTQISGDVRDHSFQSYKNKNKNKEMNSSGIEFYSGPRSRIIYVVTISRGKESSFSGTEVGDSSFVYCFVCRFYI